MRSRTSHHPRKGLLCAIALVMFIALGALPLTGQGGGSIEGQVLMVNNLPIPPHITVRLESAEGTYVDQTYLSPDGKFSFQGLRRGLYRVVVSGKGYRTATRSVDMGWLASRIVRVFMIPEVKKMFTSPESSVVTATDLSAPKTAREELEKGLRALERGNFSGARKHLEKAVAEHSCYARAYTALGVALSMKGQFNEAEAAFNKSISCDAAFVEAYIQFANILNAQNKYQDCEATLQKGLGRFPNDWHLHYQLGIAKDGSGDYAGAEKALLKAQAINPEVPPEFHLRIADVYLNSQQYDKAHAEMASYLRADPHGSYAKPTRQIMRHLEIYGMVSKPQATEVPKKQLKGG